MRRLFDVVSDVTYVQYWLSLTPEDQSFKDGMHGD